MQENTRTKYNRRPDHQAGHRAEYERNRKRILKTQSICGICKQPVDKSLKYPDPYSATVDHIIPVSRGGHPSDINNLQLAHFRCNRLKWDKLQAQADDSQTNQGRTTGLSVFEAYLGFPWSIDWTKYKVSESGKSNSLDLSADADRLKARGYTLTIHGVRPQ